MTDFPRIQLAYNRDVILTHGPESIGVDILNCRTVSTVTTAWPSANLALYIPFTVQQTFIVRIIRLENGGAVSGNIDVGVYDDQKNRLVSKGPTAQAGTSVLQDFDVTDTTLYPGVYYAAMSMSVASASALVRGFAAANPMPGMMGVLQQAAAGTLPATSTPVASTGGFIPIIALMGRSVA